MNRYYLQLKSFFWLSCCYSVLCVCSLVFGNSIAGNVTRTWTPTHIAAHSTEWAEYWNERFMSSTILSLLLAHNRMTQISVIVYYGKLVVFLKENVNDWLRTFAYSLWFYAHVLNCKFNITSKYLSTHHKK